MAVREIRVQGDAVLGKVCKEVKALTPRNMVLIEDMLDTILISQDRCQHFGILRAIAVGDGNQFIRISC